MEIVIQLHPLLPAQYPKLASTSCLLRDMVSGHDRDGLAVGPDDIKGLFQI